MFEVEKTLPIGLEQGGVVHREFALRPLKVIDTIEAIEEVGETSGIRLEMAIAARQITRFGTLAKDAITAELLGQLWDQDMGAINAARDEAEKKLKASSGNSAPTE